MFPDENAVWWLRKVPMLAGTRQANSVWSLEFEEWKEGSAGMLIPESVKRPDTALSGALVKEHYAKLQWRLPRTAMQTSTVERETGKFSRRKKSQETCKKLVVIHVALTRLKHPFSKMGIPMQIKRQNTPHRIKEGVPMLQKYSAVPASLRILTTGVVWSPSLEMAAVVGGLPLELADPVGSWEPRNSKMLGNCWGGGLPESLRLFMEDWIVIETRRHDITSVAVILHLLGVERQN